MIFLAPLADAQSGSGSPALTYIPGSSVKLYQVNGDCDWAEWDATIRGRKLTIRRTGPSTDEAIGVGGPAAENRLIPLPDISQRLPGQRQSLVQRLDESQICKPCIQYLQAGVVILQAWVFEKLGRNALRIPVAAVFRVAPYTVRGIRNELCCPARMSMTASGLSVRT